MLPILERTFGAEQAADIRFSPRVIVWWLFVLLWVATGLRFADEDWRTTELGYNALPTQALYADTGFWVAIFLFILPIVGTLLYVRTRQDRWWWLSLLGLGVDLLFDTAYRVVSNPLINPVGWGIEVVIALIQGIFIFTLGSEVALAVGLPLLLELTPDLLAQIAALFSRTLALARRLEEAWDE